MKKEISIKDYEIGKHYNFDIISFYKALPEKEGEEEQELIKKKIVISSKK